MKILSIQSSVAYGHVGNSAAVFPLQRLGHELRRDREDGDIDVEDNLRARKHVTEACHAALKRMQVDYLDLYFCHRPDIDTPIEETVWAMHNLITQGKVLYWGTSEWNAQQLTEAWAFARANSLIGPSMEQPQYNLFVREKAAGRWPVSQAIAHLHEIAGPSFYQPVRLVGEVEPGEPPGRDRE